MKTVKIDTINKVKGRDKKWGQIKRGDQNMSTADMLHVCGAVSTY